MSNEEIPGGIGSGDMHQAILYSLYEPILITDGKCRVLEANARARDVFCLEGKDLCAKSVTELVSGFDDGIMKNLLDALETQRHIIIEASCVRQDGQLFPVSMAVNKVEVRGETRLCFSIRDVSAINQTQTQLEDAQEEILKMEKVKTRLDTITTLAHEINNPLQTLMGMVEADRNVRYAAPLTRIVSVMQEMRRDEELKRVKYAGESYKFEIPGSETVRSQTKSILIADDEPTLLKFFESVLKHAYPDMFIETVSNGAEALAAFHLRHHAMIILDISMPVMTGDAAFHEIKKTCKEKKWEMPAVIFCTGYTPPDTIREAIARDNIHCYLPKPMTGETLVNAVRNRLEFYELCHPRGQ